MHPARVERAQDQVGEEAQLRPASLSVSGDDGASGTPAVSQIEDRVLRSSHENPGVKSQKSESRSRESQLTRLPLIASLG